MVVHADETEKVNTLINHIQAYLYQKKEWNPRWENAFAPALCNRIDRNTADVLELELTARTTLDAVCDRCGKAFPQEKEVTYQCLLAEELQNEDNDEIVRKVKKFKAGFVISDSNLTPENTLADVIALVQRTEHSTIGVTDDGTPNGKLLGMVTSRDYRAEKDSPDKKVKEFMTPFSKLIVGELGMTLSEANQIIRKSAPIAKARTM